MGKAPLVLIVDDELAIRRFLRAGLPATEYQVIEAETGIEAVRLVATNNPAVVLLDLGLPDIDGLDVTAQIREWSSVPIIVLSARGQESDKIKALDGGANDYLTKPFSIGELLARIRVVLRPVLRGGVDEAGEIAVGPIRIDLARRLVFRDGQEVHLTPLEYKLLASLMRNAGKVLTHKYLMDEVWGPAYSKETHYLRIFMKQLRHKLENDPACPRYLVTESGVGYRMRLDT